MIKRATQTFQAYLVRVNICALFSLFLFGVTAEAEPLFGPTQSQRHFASDDFVIFGKDGEGKDFLLTLMFCRKQLGEKDFVHYRFAALIYDGLNINLSESFHDARIQEVAHDFLEGYENIGADDLSARESFRLSLKIGSKKIEVSIPDLQGEFLIKNTPDYMKFASESPAEITVDGKKLALRAYVEKIFAEDYDTYVFFPGHGKIRSETHSFELWDELGNLYVLDTSQVSEKNPSYRSHTWVLHKNLKLGTLKKAFDAQVSFKEAGEQSASWLIRIPALDVSRLKLHVVQNKDGKTDEGLVTGEIEVGGETRKIGGYYAHHLYR